MKLSANTVNKTPTVFTEDAERLQFRKVLSIDVSTSIAEQSVGGSLDVNYRTSKDYSGKLLTNNYLCQQISYFAVDQLMKKFFTIGITVLLVLAEMHVAVASHFCGGAVADTKVSLTGKSASCGMMHDANSASSETTFSSNCCKDETSVYKVDDNYAFSEFKFNLLAQNIYKECYIPTQYTFYSNIALFTAVANVSPPSYYFRNAMGLADICVFRI